MDIFSQISHKIFQKNIDTKFNIRIKRWFAVKQAPSWGGESQTAQGGAKRNPGDKISNNID